MYVSHAGNRDEPYYDLEDVRRRCEVEFGGSTDYKDIIVTRLAADKLDRDGATLVRLKSDGPTAVTASPHLLAVRVDK